MRANELSSKDLMVGDWLKHYNGTPMQVTKITTEHFACAENGGMNCWEYNNKYEPIPLTSEILEKNGFIQDTDYPFRFFKPKIYKIRDIGVDFTIKGFSFWMGDTVSIACGNGSRINRLSGYVHELQHALRLCKVDKEIVV